MQKTYRAVRCNLGSLQSNLISVFCFSFEEKTEIYEIRKKNYRLKILCMYGEKYVNNSHFNIIRSIFRFRFAYINRFAGEIFS